MRATVPTTCGAAMLVPRNPTSPPPSSTAAESNGTECERPEKITSPGARRWGRTRPSRVGPWLLKAEISPTAFPVEYRVVPPRSTHEVLVTNEPTAMTLLALAGLWMVRSLSPGTKRADRGSRGGLKSPPEYDHMSKVPAPKAYTDHTWWEGS